MSSKRFFYDINDNKLNVNFEKAIRNEELFVVGTNGKVGDVEKLSKLYAIRETAEYYNFGGVIAENYQEDDGINFTASLSFIKKDW